MYTFSIEKDNTTLVEIKILNLVAEDPYFKDLIEKCFERVFSIIGREEKDSSEEADLEIQLEMA